MAAHGKVRLYAEANACSVVLEDHREFGIYGISEQSGRYRLPLLANSTPYLVFFYKVSKKPGVLRRRRRELLSLLGWLPPIQGNGVMILLTLSSKEHLLLR